MVGHQFKTMVIALCGLIKDEHIQNVSKLLQMVNHFFETFLPRLETAFRFGSL